MAKDYFTLNVMSGIPIHVKPRGKEKERLRLKHCEGGAVAEWSWVLLNGEKINENQKDPGFAPRPGPTLKNAKAQLYNSNILRTKLLMVVMKNDQIRGQNYLSVPIKINSH